MFEPRLQGILSVNFYHHRIALAEATADGRCPTASASAAQAVDQRHDDPRTTRAERMTDCNCASMNIRPVSQPFSNCLILARKN